MFVVSQKTWQAEHKKQTTSDEVTEAYFSTHDHYEVRHTKRKAQVQNHDDKDVDDEYESGKKSSQVTSYPPFGG